MTNKEVFISWKGLEPLAIAVVLKETLAKYDITSFVSSLDIDMFGETFYKDILSALKHSKLGVIILSENNNANRDWLLFEAGALCCKKGGKDVTIVTYKAKEEILPDPLKHKQCLPYSQRFIGDLVQKICAKLKEREVIFTDEDWKTFQFRVKEEINKILAREKEVEKGNKVWGDAIQNMDKSSPGLAEELKQADTENNDKESKRLAQKINKNKQVKSIIEKAYSMYPTEALIKAAAIYSQPPAMLKALQNVQNICKHLDLPSLQKTVVAATGSPAVKYLEALRKSFNRFKPLFPPDDDKKNDEEDDDRDDAQPLLPVKKK